MKNTMENEEEGTSVNWDDHAFEESLLTELDLEKACTLNISKLRSDERYSGFDNNTGENWIYPNNLPVRSYQFEIARNSLFRNTLVVLPTGLGKTLIAAVVIYNIYRWYPTGKVIFMAPTRPLVSQQIEACCKIMGIPMSDTVEMTGNKRNSSRHPLWHSKRVFFATPQTVQVDISDDSFDFPFDAIKLVIVDEAHKAKGRYAYTEVVQQINEKNPYFRVVGLSATPGRRLEEVIEIVQNLLITQIEHRTENSIDVQKYVQKKHIKVVPIELDDELKGYKNELLEILDPYIRTLLDNSIISGTAGNFNKNLLLYEQKRFERENTVKNHPNAKEVKTSFSVAISLCHVLELLERHGLRVFINYFETDDDKEKFLIYIIPRLKTMVREIREKIGPNPFAISVQTMPNGKVPEVPKNLDFGHPKFEKARKFVLEHFEKNKDSRAIVFCEYRESVNLIYRLLLQHRPIVKPRSFVGQGSSSSIKAVTQKEQLQIMEDFKKGICNTLIATSVAEEGLDVGEVDLIICFDICTTNPTRFIQRIGRTGRKRQGYVIILATEGKELANSKEVISNKDNSNLKLYQHKDLKNAFYKACPRIVPPEFNPKAIQTYIKIPEENQTKGVTSKKTTTRKNAKVDIPGTQDVRKFFQKVEKPVEIIRTPKSTPTEVEVYNISSESEGDLELEVKSDFDLDSMIKNLEKMRNNLGKKLPSNVGPVKNMKQTMKSKTVSKEVKRYILEENPEYLREKFESYEIFGALGETSNPLELTEEEKQLKVEFEAIKSVFGSKFDVEEFLKTQESEKEDLKELDKYSYLFEGLEERDFFDDNTKFIEEMFAKVKWEDKDKEVYLNHFEDDDDDVVFVESKYLSQQVSSPIAQKKSRTMSTPLNKNFLNRMPLKFDESPILRKNKGASFSQAFESTFEVPEEVLEEDERKEAKEIKPPEEKEKLPAIVEEKEETVKENAKSISDIFGEDFTFPEEIPLEILLGNRTGNPLENNPEFIPDALFDSDFELEDLPDESSPDKKEDKFFEDDDCFNIFEDNPKQYKFASPSKIKESLPPVSLWDSHTSLVDIDELKRILDQENPEEKADEIEDLLTPEDFCEPFEEEKTPSVIFLSDSSSNDKENYVFPSTPKVYKSPFVKNLTDNDEISPCVLRKRPSKIRPTKSQKELPFKDIFINQEELNKENEGRPTTPDASIEISQSVYKSPFVKKLESGGDRSPSAIKSRPGLGSLKSKLMRNEGLVLDESLIVPRRKPSRRIESDEESAEDSPLRPSSKMKRARLVDSDVEESPLCNKRSRLAVESDPDSPVVRRKGFGRRNLHDESDLDSPIVPKAKKRIQRGFVDEEAAHSGEDSSEGEHESMSEVSQYLLDSMIVNESSVKDDSSVNMQAIYLQSVRSPSCRQLGKFKIPEPRPFNISDIYSQAVEPETSVAYDSFVTEEEDSYYTPSDVNDISIRPELFMDGARNRHTKKEELSKKFKNLRDTFKSKLWK